MDNPRAEKVAVVEEVRQHLTDADESPGRAACRYTAGERRAVAARHA